jgi:uncharacterized protein (TIGR02996 family)
MTDETTFLQAVEADPGDPALRLVFADWLDERGDPRGPFVRLQGELAAMPADDPRRPDARRRLRALRDAGPESVRDWDRHFALARVRRKLDQLRDRDPAFDLFGANSHRYQLNPPLTEEEVAAFERETRVRLPGDYRAFLLRLGNGGVGRYGGAGPYYGVYTLRRNPDWEAQYPLDRPFPITNRRARNILTRQQQARSRNQWYSPRIDYPLPGCLELAEMGCGMVTFLVVTGEQRGTVWCGGDGLGVLADDDGRQLGFLDWYEEWLDGALAPGGGLEYWQKQRREYGGRP